MVSLHRVILDLGAPRLLEVPPDSTGLGRGSPIRRIRMRAGYEMLVDIRVPEQGDAWRTGLYEEAVLSIALQLVPDGGVFLDVGANVGFYACAVSWGLAGRSGRLYAFEPVSSNRERLQKNISLNGLQDVVTVVPYALGDASGRLTMRRVPLGKAANAVGENVFSQWDRENADRDGWGSEEVEMIRLDDWSSCLRRCDVLKIDVEGADLLVLRGGRRTIERFRPVVLAEFNPYWMRQIHQSLHDVRRLAGEVDYEVLRLSDGRFRLLADAHEDRDEEVPSYLLTPKERLGDISNILE